MSATPETDAAVKASGGDWSPVLRAVSQRLERERDEARAEWGKASMDAAQLLSEKTKVMAERDEARKMLVRSNHFLQQAEENLKLIYKERDEARKEINGIRITLSKNGEAVGNGEIDFSIIEMIENLIQSKDYFVRKSDSLERERDEARDEAALWKWHWMAARKEVENLIKEGAK